MGVGVIDAVDIVFRHQQDFGADFEGAEGRGGVGGHKGVAGAGGKDDYPAFFEVAHCAAADVGFGDGLDLQGALGAGDDAAFFQGVLQGQGVDDGGQHTGVVGGGPVHTAEFGLFAAPDVAAADDYSQLQAHLTGFVNLAGQVVDGVRVDAGRGGAFEGFAAEFQQDALVLEGRRSFGQGGPTLREPGG